MNAAAEQKLPRGIAVVDVGYTNSKVILFDASLKVVAERKMASPHHMGAHYPEIDVAPIVDFVAQALRDLDGLLAIDRIVTSAHGACVVALDAQGAPAVPVMDYMAEPPPDILRAYQKVMPGYAEVFTPPLPMALLHGMQLFWQQSIMPEAFRKVTTILPLMQYVAHCLGGRATTEVSSMSCQSHLVDMRDGKPSSLARRMGWNRLYAPEAKAWEVIGALKPALRGSYFQGRGEITAGVHDSNANYFRYLAGGLPHFTLLSTGTWIIGFDTDAEIARLDPARDLVANTDIFGRTVACFRFFGGKEFEVLGQGASGSLATLPQVEGLIRLGVMALPTFTDSGGPMPGTGGKGRIAGPFADGEAARASLASLYCALMVSESLDAIHSRGSIIVDGPFSQNEVFLSLLAALRPSQKVLASEERDGTAAGAACIGLMTEGLLPRVDIAMRQIAPASIAGLADYQLRWRQAAMEGAHHA